MKTLKFLLKLSGALLAIAGAAYLIITYLDEIKALFSSVSKRLSNCCGLKDDDEYADFAD